MLLVFTLEGEHADLDWVRSRVDGAIRDVVDEAHEEDRLDGVIEISWEWGED